MIAWDVIQSHLVLRKIIKKVNVYNGFSGYKYNFPFKEKKALNLLVPLFIFGPMYLPND